MKTILYAILFLSIVLTSCSVSTGKKTTDLTFNSGELRYTDSITETQAKALGNYLVETGFYDGVRRTVQLDKVNGIIHFAMVVDDSVANSPQFQTTGIEIVDELQQSVFKGYTVEVDYCDGYFKVIKNIKGRSGEETSIEATPVSTISPSRAVVGSWVCSNITGGDEMNAKKQAADLEWLKVNFMFSFADDYTFFSSFINQKDITTPLDVEGQYQVTDNKISLHNLKINNEFTDQEMHFGIEFNEGGFQLISKTPGNDDLVMSFVKQQPN